MTTKQLSKLQRSELLEILLDQRKKIDSLEEENAELRARLEDRQILLEKSGSIAEASLALTSIFAEAQKAADLYVMNVKRKAALDK